MSVAHTAFALTAFVVAIGLHGCGKGPSPSPSSQTTTTTTTKTAPTPAPGPGGWKLAPIEVHGPHLYDSVTKKQFRGKGIAMPNVGEDVQEWIRVLQRIKELSPVVNLVRIYVPPTCALNSPCFEPFMREADKLGIYVIVPGTGTTWGWLPGAAKDCGKKPTPQSCYKVGGVLGFGQTVIQHFNYPNTLAIVIGNEFDMQMLEFIPLLKAYARDLKSYMKMCNTDSGSPTNNMMRSIPLMFASSDDRGNDGVKPKADYLFCGDSTVSIDIFGLNIERWCEDHGGKIEYTNVNKWVGDAKYPGAFIFSEEGCARTSVQNQTRPWTQLAGFFSNFDAIDGFAAYTYSGNKDFDMFDGPTSKATLFEDGQNFFKRLADVGTEPEVAQGQGVKPECPKEILGKDLSSYDDVKGYDTGETGWAPHCPKPYQKDVPSVRSEEYVF